MGTIRFKVRPGSHFGGSETCKDVGHCFSLRAEREPYLPSRELAHLLNMICVDFGSSSTRFKNVVVSETSNVTPARVLCVGRVGCEETG